jgi:hypothetical protein
LYFLFFQKKDLSGRYLALVDLAEPLARSVTLSLKYQAEVCINLSLTGVPTLKMEEAAAKALSCLRDIAAIDTDRLKSIIATDLLEEISSLEESAAESIQENVVSSDWEFCLLVNKQRVEHRISVL